MSRGSLVVKLELHVPGAFGADGFPTERVFTSRVRLRESFRRLYRESITDDVLRDPTDPLSEAIRDEVMRDPDFFRRLATDLVAELVKSREWVRS